MMTVVAMVINKQVQSDGTAYSSPIIDECITLWSAIHYIIGGGVGSTDLCHKFGLCGGGVNEMNDSSWLIIIRNG